MQATKRQADSAATTAAGHRRVRKSRGRGLRTASGCQTCRKRHVKCDEAKPICAQCAKGSRQCVYPTASHEAVDGSTESPSGVYEEDAARRERHLRHASFSNLPDAHDAVLDSSATTAAGDDIVKTTSPRGSYGPFTGYGSETAPLRWFGLLAHDAADISLDISQTRHSRTTSFNGSISSVSCGDAGTIVNGSAERLNEEIKLWQSREPLQLQAHEHGMFHRFVNGISLWIDLFDPLKHFSFFVPHLALRNQGLSKALLALGARHLSIRPTADRDPSGDHTAAVQYYSETLQYLQSAMRYISYKQSLELLATVLIVSTYEMVDGAGKGWERHLKGVFWLQRSREINGESGGLEQSIWWAWLRQDVWAAFRERRRCYSFFKPTKAYREMDVWDIASRIVYILAQAVNYSSDEEKQQGEADLTGRVFRAKVLFDMLDEWKSNTSIHFQPLPTEEASSQAFKPVWIQPSAFGAALQMYHMARILLLVHQPAAGGYLEYIGREKAMTDCIDNIGGIALTLTDDASRLMSTQCLFAAGLYCTHHEKRDCIASLIDDHLQHTGWPSNTNLSDELRAEWSKSSSNG